MAKKKKSGFDMGWIIMIACVVVGLAVAGCANLLGGPESPRPKEYQVEATKEIITQNTTKIMESQLGKQDGIEAIALAALVAIGTSKTDTQMEAITNVVANTAASLERTQGVEKQLARMTGSGAEGLSDMSAIAYGMYAASQTAVSMGNREKMYSGIKAGFKWTQNKIMGMAGGGLAGGGLIGMLVGYMRKNGQKAVALNATKKTYTEDELSRLKKALENTGSENLI